MVGFIKTNLPKLRSTAFMKTENRMCCEQGIADACSQ